MPISKLTQFCTGDYTEDPSEAAPICRGPGPEDKFNRCSGGESSGTGLSRLAARRMPDGS